MKHEEAKAYVRKHKDYIVLVKWIQGEKTCFVEGSIAGIGLSYPSIVFRIPEMTDTYYHAEYNFIDLARIIQEQKIVVFK